ncbi:MAG: V-type ATP synthase subunit I [Bacillota bacterium]|nr:V-type ATP synthase subunit I [Bacillota bacterium]
MAVVEMRRVTILGHQSLHEAVLRELQTLGTVQVDDVRQALQPEEREALFPENGTAGSPAEDGQVSRDRRADAHLDTQTAQVQRALDLLDRFFRPKKGVIETFAGIRFPLSEKEYRERAQATQRIAELVARARDLDERLTSLQAREAELKSRLGLLRPWSDLDVPREELRDTRLFRIVTGQVSAGASESLGEELAAASPAAGYEVVGQNREALLVVLYYPKADEERVLSVARSHDWTAVTLPEFAGTVTDEIARVESALDEIVPERQRLIAAVEQLLSERLTLYARYEHLRNEQVKEEAKERLGYTERLFLLRGWTRRRDVARLRQAMERLSPAVVVEDEAPAPGEAYPVDLENPPLVRPFEVVTRVAGLPAAGALDPSPYLAPFFFIFFGLMLGDAGYGILLMVGGLWLVKRARAVGLGRQLMYLLSLCGVSTFLAGMLTGSWFGNLFGIPPLWFDPLKNPVKMLVLSVALGVVQIFTALGIKAYDNIRKGNALDALYDQGFWLVFLSGLILMLVSAAGGGLAALAQPARYLALAGAVALVLTQGRSKRNILARLGAGVLSLYGVSGYLSDVLSYSRLLALGLSGTVIAMVLNFGANLIRGVPVIGWLLMAVILVAGHLFDLLISAVGAYVHASRLQYVEFFTKFFEAGGKPFKPLTEGHRHLLIEPEAAPSERQ